VNLLVLGAGGMLGHQLWLQLGLRHRVLGTLRAGHAGLRRLETADRRLATGVDARSEDGLAGLLDQERPEVLLNAVGVIKQLPEGKDPEACLRLNSLLPHVLHRLCRERGIRLIHISTDCVFSGARGGYREADPPDADDLYGRSKALGEVGGPGALTLRTSIIGHELKHGLSLLEWFLAQAGAVAGYAGVRWNGVTTVELARVLDGFVLPRPELEGLFQMAAAPLSKADLLRRIAAVYGCDTRVAERAEPVNDKTLDGSRFAAATGWRAPDWDEMLARMRDERRRHADLYQ
jgi:dTDP-4-dehydrorhamnose reductase